MLQQRRLTMKHTAHHPPDCPFNESRETAPDMKKPRGSRMLSATKGALKKNGTNDGGGVGSATDRLLWWRRPSALGPKTPLRKPSEGVSISRCAVGDQARSKSRPSPQRAPPARRIFRGGCRQTGPAPQFPTMGATPRNVNRAFSPSAATQVKQAHLNQLHGPGGPTTPLAARRDQTKNSRPATTRSQSATAFIL